MELIFTDYYNYYYGNSYENTEATDVPGPTATVGQDPSEANEATEVPVQPDTHTAPKTEVGCFRRGVYKLS